MGFGLFFAKIPWRQVIGFAPEIVLVAQKIYENVKKTLGMKRSSSVTGSEKRESSLSELDRRVERLEANEMQQAELVRDMARQVGDLSAATRILSKRLHLAMLLAVVALAGVVVLALTTWK